MFQLQSLRQLILLSFTLVLAPLLLLLWQSHYTLNQLAQQAETETRYAVALINDVNQLQGLIVDIERVSRQYQVLNTQTLKELSESYLSNYLQTWKNLCESLVEKMGCIDKARHITWLQQVSLDEKSALNNALSQVKADLKQQAGQIQQHLNYRLNLQQQRIAQVQARQFSASVILFSISLLAALYASRKILKPVNQLESMILQLADKSHKLAPVAVNGPKELVALQYKLHQLARRLAQLESLRKALLRHAAHELKTPLASIKEGCSLLIEEVVGDLNQSQQEVVQLLNTSSLRMETLVGQLLDYNLLLQQAQANAEVVELTPFVEQFLRDHQLVLKDHRLEVNLQCKQVHTDPLLLRRILDNLLSNAVAHGTPKGMISICSLRQQRHCILQVANQGKAIDLSNQQHYFQPFHKANQQRQDRVSGAGLGLSIVSECATLLAADIRFIDVDYADVCVQVTLKGAAV